LDDSQKLTIYNRIGAVKIISELRDTFADVERLMQEETQYRLENTDYLSIADRDSSAVKMLLAGLRPPLTDEEGKKLTVADKDNWLQLQRVENEALAYEIAKQKEVSFTLDSIRTELDIAKRKVDVLKSISGLTEATLNFLGG